MGETYQPGAPVSAADPFADDFLRDPFAFHEELREAGPVVWLERYRVWALTLRPIGGQVPWAGRVVAPGGRW
jgi:hypothetical protein